MPSPFDIDFSSLVGHEGVVKQYNFIRAIPKTKVKLFVPSDLGSRVDEERATIPVLRAKAEVEKASKDAGIPTTVVLPGNFVESTFSTQYVSLHYSVNFKAKLSLL
jgi:uncharacterized protein YbjT (DUF2867 family)